MDQSTDGLDLAPLARHGVDEQIAEALVDAIVSGRVEPGSTLPPERELAAQLQVNRTSLRQALARVAQIGLIEPRQGHGNVVLDPATVTDPAVLRSLMRQLGPDFLGELLELRAALGDVIGRLAATRARPDDVIALDGALDRVRLAGSPADRQQAELAFFSTLVQATHNRPLGMLMRWVAATYGTAPDDFVAAFDDAAAVDDGLGRIRDAVADRDADAAIGALRTYLDDSTERLRDAAATGTTTSRTTNAHTDNAEHETMKGQDR